MRLFSGFRDKLKVILNDELLQDENTIENELDRMMLYDAIKDLNPRDKKIIVMRYFRDMTQSEIAKMLGVSQVQISRLENKILKNIREKIE